MNLRPLNDRVIVKRIESKPRPPRASSSPTTPPKSPTKAKCWPWARASTTKTASALPLSVKVGDRVLFGKYSGQTVKVDGDELLGDERRRPVCRRRKINRDLFSAQAHLAQPS
jgi:chaperonin GroES